MIITKIELENWKNFAEVKATCGKRMFLIGPNASGKSNFLDALLFLRDVALYGLEHAVAQRGGVKSIRYINARQHPDITVGVTIDDTWEYTLTFGTEKGKQIPLVVSEVVRQHNGEKWKKILSRPDDDDGEDSLRLTQTALQQVNANMKFRELYDFFASIQYRHILPQLVREPKAFSPAPVTNDPFGRDLVFSIAKTPEKIRKSRLAKINAALKAAVPNFEGLQIVRDSDGLPHLQVTYSHWRPQGAKQQESVFSDGTLRLIGLLWSLFDAEGPLLLEEPELSLHDGVVSLLPGIFARMDKGRKKKVRQVFVTTHSTSLLSDPGIGSNEVLRLEPGREGVLVRSADEQERKLIQQGLTVADVMLPKTRPGNLQDLSIF